jgi:transposase
MTLHPRNSEEIPSQTKTVARQVFPQGNLYLRLRDELGVIYHDAQFTALFCTTQGQPAYSPGQLALVTVMQFLENLTDRQAAEAVRSRIDWKYMLGLELSDPGFHYSILSEFRGRLIARGVPTHLLNELLRLCQTQGLLKKGGKQRTDSTHVLAAVRQLNRLEVVGETLRHSLEILSTVAPEWLVEQVDESWFERYSTRVEQSKLAKSKAQQRALILQIGVDGHALLTKIDEDVSMAWLREIPAVQHLRQIWIQQYYVQGMTIQWREASDLPPSQQLIQSPYDVEVRNRTKRQTNWTGYMVHLSETCNEDGVNLITQVTTTAATTGDSQVLSEIHQALTDQDLCPEEHLVDMGYFHSHHLVESAERGIDLVQPVPLENSWATRAANRFTIPCFAIDWEEQSVTCPMQNQSISWIPAIQSDGDEIIRVRFSIKDCRGCCRQSDCCSNLGQARQLHLLPQPQFLALAAARSRQTQPEFQQRYAQRAGVEGTISQAVRAFELRRTRYIGLAKTHLQQVAIATAINWVRLSALFQSTPKGQTRISRFAALKPRFLMAS